MLGVIYREFNFNRLEQRKTMKFGGVNVGILDIRTSVNEVSIAGVAFVKEIDTVQIQSYGELKEVVKLKIQTVGDLQRFAVEWYYQNILNQNFGGKEMAPYEVVLRNY